MSREEGVGLTRVVGLFAGRLLVLVEHVVDVVPRFSALRTEEVQPPARKSQQPFRGHHHISCHGL